MSKRKKICQNSKMFIKNGKKLQNHRYFRFIGTGTLVGSFIANHWYLSL